MVNEIGVHFISGNKEVKRLKQRNLFLKKMIIKKCVTKPISEKIHDFNLYLLAPNYLSLRDLLVF